MLNFDTPRLDLYTTTPIKLRPKPTVLHQRTCPVCNRKLVNLYIIGNEKKYVCKRCLEKGGAEE